MGNENLRQDLDTTVSDESAEAAGASSVQHEDIALKTAFQYFSEELLPYFGITGKVMKIAPTELVYLDVKKFHEDMNFVMENGSWVHFEFQSKNEGLEGLKRFRTYEALASYQHKVSVTTYVLFSGRIKNPMTEFHEGINTFRIVPIIIRSRNADELIGRLQEKQECGEELTKEDMALLTLCLLMDGKMSLKDRVEAAYQITWKAASISREEQNRIEAVLYVMADKFLDSAEMDELMEVISVTRLGQKLVNKGKEEEKLEIAQNLIGLLDDKVIAQRTGLSLETVLRLKEKQTSAPIL